MLANKGKLKQEALVFYLQNIFLLEMERFF